MGARQRLLIGAAVAMLAAGAIVVSGRLDLAPEIVIPIATLLGAAIFIVVLGPARGGLACLLLMAALNRYSAEIFGASLKPEHFVAPVVAAALLPQWRSLVPELARR